MVRRLSDEDGGGFLASAPDLPGCMSDGATQEEAIENLRDAIEAWLDEARALGREIPDPKSFAMTA
jgi:antitoxin HicB